MILLMLIALIAIIIIASIIVLSCDTPWYNISYEVDKDNNKDSKLVTFDEFKELFEGEIWIQNKNFKCNFENQLSDSKLFCSEYKINGTKYFFKTLKDFREWHKYIKDHQLKSNNIYQTSVKKIESRLVNTLQNLCRQLKIKLSYHDDLGDAAGMILYHSSEGRYLLDNSEIQIRKDCENQPWVLAHEIGHYMGIKDRDTSEDRANKEAHNLIKSILTGAEYLTMFIPLNVRYEQYM